MITFFLPPKECERPYSITQINDGIASVIESGNTLVWVEGEISNFKRASSGHCYFKLKDAQSQVPAVMWRSVADTHDNTVSEGAAVTAIASIKVYRKGGYYQLDVHRMQQAGQGALFVALEKLKQKLETEGLFDPIHKQEIPESVTQLGVITAKTGAALRDICKVVASRAPQTDILLRSVAVQGDKAPKDIAFAIEEMNTHNQVDCIILGRGGGSVEDLWAFNDEAVVRAIFNSTIPIISAVGHEIDFTLADFVADLRAPTPSAAAEIAVADEEELRRYFKELSRRLISAFSYYLSSAHQQFDSLRHSPVFSRTIAHLTDSRQHLDQLWERAIRAMGSTMDIAKNRVVHCAGKLQALNPLAVLARGYSVVSKNSLRPITKASQLAPGDNITITFHKGQASAQVISLNKERGTPSKTE